MAAASTTNLVDLVTCNANATVYPSEDAILSVLQARLRADQPYSWIGGSILLVTNPLRILSNLNESSAEDYVNRCYAKTDWQTDGRPHPAQTLPPHPYELAIRAYHAMRRTGGSQAIVFSGATNSGKSFTSKLITAQLLRIASHATVHECKLADQVHALERVLDSFSCAKTCNNGNASRAGRYLELHFSTHGRLASAKMLTFGLEKGRVCAPLAADERTFHVFYQLLDGATSEERDMLRLEDLTSYKLLSSSGCFRVAGGPAGDDTMAMEDLRASMKILGFKPRQLTASWSVLSAILLLSNIEFHGPSPGDNETVEGAGIANPTVLQDAALLLGVEVTELQQSLVLRTRFVRKETVTTVLSPDGAAAQRDSLCRDLYATLLAFVVETANHRMAPDGMQQVGSTCIAQLDVPGFQTKQVTSVDVADGARSNLSSHYEFTVNYVAELVQNWISRCIFDDDHTTNAEVKYDEVVLPEVLIGDNTPCVELLRGSSSIGEGNDEDHRPGGMLATLSKLARQVRSGDVSEDARDTLLEEFDAFSRHASYVPSTLYNGRPMFGVNHYQGKCTYDAANFLRQEIDNFDATFVNILRQSEVPFVARLFSGPSLASEPHPLDPEVIADAQVSVRPLRQPSRLDSGTAQSSPMLNPQRPYIVTRQVNAAVSEMLATVQQGQAVWTVLAVRPNDIDQPNVFEARCVKTQLRALLIPDTVARKRHEYFTGMTFEDFCLRYAACGVVQASIAAGVEEPREKVQAFCIAFAWRESVDYAIGREKFWLCYAQWRALEDRLRTGEPVDPSEALTLVRHAHKRMTSQLTLLSELYGLPDDLQQRSGEWDTLLVGGKSNPFADALHEGQEAVERPSAEGGKHDYGIGSPALEHSNILGKEGVLIESRDLNAVEEEPITRVRRWWIRFTWFFTWWIPDKLLASLGGMKRPDVQMAWREKVTICSLIFLSCAFILFYILVFGRIICPDANRAWNTGQLGEHAAPTSYYVAVRGKVYDLTKFWRLQHSDSASQSTNDVMLQLAGQDLTPYFPIPLTVGCPGLVTDQQLTLQTNSSSFYYSATISQAVHTSGPLGDQTSKLSDINWYPDRFLPFMAKYYKGYFVTSKKDIASQAGDRQWAIVDNKVYDLGDYLWTLALQNNVAINRFLPQQISDLFGSQAGSDITSDFHSAMYSLNETTRAATQNCLDNVFYAGLVDFRDTARCQVQNYLLLSFSVLLVATILAKFLAALQLAPKRNPEQQDKFVICQVPCYTEGEEELRKTIDSLAALQYDDKRKLMFIICDGMIIGNGNEQPTPRIALDILGVDPKLEPEPQMFKSVAEGSKQLNYGKVYSGLYEFEGHVVPYIVVVKVGRPSERTRPGNRGKRDSQILLMRYLNRVHFDAPMYPLELEIYHHMKNIIGIDPAFYEYILTVDADTTVDPEGLNRLVAVAADDSRVIAVCGETKIFNEEGSWWTMIQVYEYYISHHLSKAFESLFGSVTCLPGCFSMYRIRSADKGRPLVISNRVIDDYSENRVDTLHKKNLLSLGEDRYLTTLILKHFPAFSTKFTSDARAQTTAPDRWGVLLSQRRRWINSTVHNLAELLLMPELCGFCFFSMRFIVFIDLLGTIILPATTVYLVYLIITVATDKTSIPYISLAMLGAVYGLQMLIFLLKRQWQYLGWLVIYLIAYPVWSFFLPIYSFWHMDDFSWGNTRIVVGEKGNKKIVAGTDDEPYDDSMLPLKRYSDRQREIYDQPHDTASFRSRQTSVTASGPFANPSPAGSPYAASRAGSEYAAPTGSSVKDDYFQNTNVLDRSPHSREGSSSLPMRPEATGMTPSPSMMGSMMMPSSYGPYMSPAPSMYGLPPAPMPSMYGMPMMHGGPATSMFGTPAPSMMGFPMGAVTSMHSRQGSPQSESGPTGQRQAYRVAAQSTGGSWGGSPIAYPSVAGNESRRRPSLPLSSSMDPFGSDGLSEPVSVLAINPKPDPNEEDIASAVRTFLARQPDLMKVSKRDVREAIIAAFPNAPAIAVTKAKVNRAVDDTLADLS